MSSRLEKILTKLYSNTNDRFYSHLFFQMDRVKSDNCPTMGVGFINGRLSLVYSEDFIEKVIKEHSEDHVITVLIHECKHVINKHLSNSKVKNTSDMLKHRINNIAMDAAINQGASINVKHVEDIGGITLKTFREMLKHKDKSFEVEADKTWHYYYNLLEEEREERAKNGELDQYEIELGDSEMDDHGQFQEMDALDHAALENAVNKAAQKAKEDGSGRLPSDIEELLKVMKKPKISWKREIQNFVGSNSKSEVKRTRTKRNRRYGIIQAGKKTDYKAKILVALDTSGSMYGDRTQAVLNEIYGIYKASPNMSIDICEVDTEIQDVFTYDGKEEFKIKGRGGTELTPALKYARENGYNAAVLLTDGEFWNEDFESYSDVQSLWVIAGNESYTSPIGKTVHIPRKDL